MSDDRYRKIERSKPRDPPDVAPKGRRLPLGIDRLFLRKRRAYLALIVFFAIGAAVGGYLGSPSTTDSTAASKGARMEMYARSTRSVSKHLNLMSGSRYMPIRHLLPRAKTGRRNANKNAAKSEQVPIVTAPRPKPTPPVEETVARATANTGCDLSRIYCNRH